MVTPIDIARHGEKVVVDTALDVAQDQKMLLPMSDLQDIQIKSLARRCTIRLAAFPAP